MKEKLKKIFTNKNLWAVFFEIICASLIFVCGYFSGLANGLTIDNSIRTELIEKTFDNSKINSKEAVNPSSFTSEVVFESIIAAGNDSTENGTSFNIVNRIYYTFIFEMNENNIKLYDVKFRLFTNVILYDNSLGFPTYESSEVIFSSPTLTLNKVGGTYFSFNKNDTISVSLPLITFEPNNDEIFLCSFFKLNNEIIFYNSYNNGLETIMSVLESLQNWVLDNIDIAKNIILIEPNNYFDSTTSFFYPLNSLINTNILNYYNDISYDTGYDTGYEQGFNNGGFSGEDLQNAYDSGFQDGKSEGYQEGYQDRKDTVEDTKDRINSVWAILEKAITSVLNVLSFEILPGIPLYICIGVPILLAVLLWFIKMGQS